MKFKIQVPFRFYMWVLTRALPKNKLISKIFYWVGGHLTTVAPSIRMSRPVSIAHLIEDVHPLPKSHKGRTYGDFVIRPKFSGDSK